MRTATLTRFASLRSLTLSLLRSWESVIFFMSQNSAVLNHSALTSVVKHQDSLGRSPDVEGEEGAHYGLKLYEIDAFIL